jgi:hypothetical protein
MVASKKTVLLDTNIWRYLFDNKRSAELKRIQVNRSAKIKISVSPTTAFEIAKLQDNQMKQNLLTLVANPCWHKHMNDSYLQSEQLFNAISRHRPELVKRGGAKPIYNALLRLHKNRRKGWWSNILDKSNADRVQLESMGSLTSVGFLGPDKPGSFDEEANRRIFEGKKLKNFLKVSKLNPSYVDASTRAFLSTSNSLVGVEDEHWRVHSLLWHVTWDNQPSIKEWLDERLHLDLMNSNNSDYIQFWLNEVTPEEVPAHWLWCFMDFMTELRKQSSGTYWDLSMATYCCDADYVISADKVFCDLVGEAGSVAEFPVARAIKVRGGQEGVIDLFQIIGEL